MSARPRRPARRLPRSERNRSSEFSAIDVCDGRERLGSVIERGNGFEAAPASGASLGVFPSVQAATNAILTARRSVR